MDYSTGYNSRKDLTLACPAVRFQYQALIESANGVDLPTGG